MSVRRVIRVSVSCLPNSLNAVSTRKLESFLPASRETRLVRREHKRLIVVGDRVLVKVEDGEERTKVGLYLPPTAVDSQAVQGGRIVATGPGLPMPDLADSSDEPWRTAPSGARETRFVPMQARVGDYALFFRKASVEITFENDRYLVVPQNAILALVRDEIELDEG